MEKVVLLPVNDQLQDIWWDILSDVFEHVFKILRKDHTEKADSLEFIGVWSDCCFSFGLVFD